MTARRAGGTLAGRARCWPVVLLLLVVTALSSTCGNAAAAEALVPAVGGLSLQLIRVSPSAVTASSALVITGTARNTGGTPITGAQIRLRLRPQLLPGRDALESWLATGLLEPDDRVLPGTARLGTLNPGLSTGFTITVPAGHSSLGTLNPFGPRAIALEARSGSTPLGLLRSSIVWMPAQLASTGPKDRIGLSLIVPITSSAVTASAELAGELAPRGRLQRLVAAAADPAIGWAIDPAVLAASARLIQNGGSTASANGAAGTPSAAAQPSNGPGASPGAGSGTGARADPELVQAAGGWLDRVRTGAAGRAVFGLPFADPDLAAVLRSSRDLPLLRGSDALGELAETEVFGRTLEATLGWPADGRLSAGAAANLARSGRTAVLLAAANEPPEPALDYTPSGRGTIRTSAGPLTGLLYDERLSALLAEAGTGQAAASVQSLLAELAEIWLERPDDTRHVLAAAPRGWNPAPAGVQALMAALRSAPWVDLSPISELRTASAPPRAAPIYRPSWAGAQLPIGHLSATLVLNRELATFAATLSDPQAVLRPLRERVAGLLALSWRGQPDQLTAARNQVRTDVEGLTGGVRLFIGPAHKLFTARSAAIPLTVVNDTPYPLKVAVQLVPDTGQLSFHGPVILEAPAGIRTPVLVRTRAIASGNVVVRAELLNSAGQPLGPEQMFTVRVRPNWETVGLITTAAILGLLLIIGLLRGFRRHRPRVPPEAIPDVDEQASQRAPGTGSIPVVTPGGGSSGGGQPMVDQ